MSSPDCTWASMVTWQRSATSTSSSSSSSSRREFADKDKCLQMLETLRQHKMRGAMGKDIHTAYPFLHAVDITRYPDYAKIVSEPMDFNKIDVRKRKLKSNRYTSLSEFSADVHLIFSNCLKYNSDPVEGADIRTMATTLRDCRRDTPSDNNNDGDDTTKKRSSKKDKKEKKKKKDKKKDKKKHHHRDKHSVEAVATATNTLSSPPLPSPPLPNVVVVAPPASATPSKSSSKLSSKVKLDLSPWEASCERLVSRILKLDFVTAMHFDAPLVQKFPDLAKIYKSIVAEPMDLGTLRHLLITHAIADPVEFVRLGRLICDNAKTFNAGPDAASVRVRETADHLSYDTYVMIL
ncbi:hypothetical protein DYB28_005944 [Aphanomyces astaci]|uniref:Bromo domain-containing protein n=1 Tax=Aphanomyces astaci TaxID=112090 RepID=A0A9X8EB17_APHAT|nr:hypothetical protein DYB28_005944 [Aphanomyces astaci]